MTLVDLTADATVYPSANDIAETDDEGRFATEQTHSAHTQNWLEGHIVSGFALPASDADLVVPIPSGEAVINGQRIVVSSSNNITVADASTNHLWLQFAFDVNGDVDTVQFLHETSDTSPANAVKIGKLVASGGAVTSTIDERDLSPVKNSSVHGGKLDIFRGGDTDGSTSIPGGAGTTTVMTITIAKGDLAGRDAKVLVLFHGHFTGATGQRAVSVEIQLNAVVQTSSGGQVDAANSPNANPVSMHVILDLDPDIVNTITLVLRGAAGSGTGTLTTSRMDALEVGNY